MVCILIDDDYDPIRSYCIWIDASWWEKHNEITPISLSLLNQKIFANNGWWPQMTFSEVTDENWHLGHHWWLKATPFRVNGSVSMRKRGSWNFAHWQHGQVTKLAWSHVTNIKKSIFDWKPYYTTSLRRYFLIKKKIRMVCGRRQRSHLRPDAVSRAERALYREACPLFQKGHAKLHLTLPAAINFSIRLRGQGLQKLCLAREPTSQMSKDVHTKKHWELRYKTK